MLMRSGLTREDEAATPRVGRDCSAAGTVVLGTPALCRTGYSYAAEHVQVSCETSPCSSCSPRSPPQHRSRRLFAITCCALPAHEANYLLAAVRAGCVVLCPASSFLTSIAGLAFNWGALLGSSAVLGACDWTVALPLYVGSIAWTIVYDTIYAHQVRTLPPSLSTFPNSCSPQDKVDDIDAGVKSTALLFGASTRPILAAFSTSFVGLLSLSGYLNSQGPAFYLISVGGAAAHLAWQLRTADLETRESCWKVFKSNRDLGAIVWAGLMVDYGLMATGMLVV